MLECDSVAGGAVARSSVCNVWSCMCGCGPLVRSDFGGAGYEVAVFFFSSRRRHTRCSRDWSSDVCSSDLYNAWLVQLIEKEQAPGLYIARQWDNILFDVMLLGLAKAVGFAAAQRIAVSLCVLVFFWGVFAFISAVTEQPPRSEERRVGKEWRS